MRLTVDLLDRRICGIKPQAQNTETYREFLTGSCDEFSIPEPELDEMGEDNLNELLKFCDILNDRIT